MSDFFKFIQQLPVQDEYYVYDEQNQTPVKIVLDKNFAEKDFIVINNDLRQKIDFTPLDNAIKLISKNGAEDKICDALVVSEKRLTFIEIKDMRAHWKSIAKEQIVKTLEHFIDDYPNEKRRKQAYLCNVAKSFPINGILSYSTKEEKESFFEAYKTRLYIGNIVYP